MRILCTDYVGMAQLAREKKIFSVFRFAALIVYGTFCIYGRMVGFIASYEVSQGTQKQRPRSVAS